jgi:DNA-binding response OmpR family regulator
MDQELPPPWFDHDLHLINGQHCQRVHWELLLILWRRRAVHTSTESLLGLLYGRAANLPEPNCIRRYISTLRTHLKGSGWAIECSKGVGYQLVETDHVAACEGITLP